MKTLKLKLSRAFEQHTLIHLLFICAGVALLWRSLPQLLTLMNPTVGLVDGGIWQLLLFSLISFLLLLSISILLFKWLLTQLAFPPINIMVLQFKNLTIWQQFVVYWASFALLFLGALLCLVAIF